MSDRIVTGADGRKHITTEPTPEYHRGTICANCGQRYGVHSSADSGCPSPHSGKFAPREEPAPEVKSCVTCRHCTVSANKYPCAVCLKSKDYDALWEPVADPAQRLRVNIPLPKPYWARLDGTPDLSLKAPPIVSPTPCCGVPVQCERPAEPCALRDRHHKERAIQGEAAVVAEALGGPTSPLATQVGGGHYKELAIQPIEYIHANGIGFAEGSVIKYVTRWRQKGGVDDLKKARHFLDLLIELEARAVAKQA